MNNDEMIGKAIDVLKNVGIVKTDKQDKEYIVKSFRSQISSFGAAVEMGSLLSAVAFFSNKGSSSIDRPKLMKAIYLLIVETEAKDCDEKALLMYVAHNHSDRSLKRIVINAAVAVKLAMNAYDLREKDKESETEGGAYDANKES